jgi:hypothetical protein
MFYLNCYCIIGKMLFILKKISLKRLKNNG